MKTNILITGITGFIGSNIAIHLVAKGYNVFGTIRNESNLSKVDEIIEKVTLINTSKLDWENNVSNYKIDVLIHCAWNGIDFDSRGDSNEQFKNINISNNYFELAKNNNFKSVIALGSQAEYGIINTSAPENAILNPIDKYGEVKIQVCQDLKNKFKGTKTHWYWVRVYSLFGENENSNWLISSTIRKLILNEHINLTPCNQRFNYLYIRDFVKQINLIIDQPNNYSGIYNVCSSTSIKLKTLLIKIAELIPSRIDLLKFGYLSYRANQPMIINGSCPPIGSFSL